MLEKEPLTPSKIIAFLQALGRSNDEDIDLAEAALVLAAFDRETKSLDRYKEHLNSLVKDTQSLIDQLQSDDHKLGLNDCLSAIETVLYDLHGYTGDKDSYDNLENANLIAVIERRKGLPIALGILYMHIAQSLTLPLRLEIHGLNFPGHFLLRISYANQCEIIDPFARGAKRTAPWLRNTLKIYLGNKAELKAEFSRRVSCRGVLLRLQNNIKIRLIEAEDPEKALVVLELMMLIAPQEPAIWREAGMLQAYLNNIVAAIETLEHYLMIEEDPRGHPEAANMLRRLKIQLN